jgi:glycosyltransferase involved in cell wall biosynthesis
MADVKDARDTKKVSFLRRIARRIAQFCYRRLSSYVFLTEQMNPLLNPKGKPYIVMEGLVDSTLENASNELADKAGRKIVMYAGALREAYGLKNLVEGFRAYENDEAQLWIFGDGDYRDEIQRNAEQDPRIKFGGAIHLSEVVKKEHQVSLLINPRPVEKEFTQYSFPSKNMEYMVSGTPILTTRLPGMPQEYYEYVYTIDGDTAVDITVALEEVFSHSEKELHEKGKKAKEFVLTRKNNIIQSKRIMELLSERSSQ